MSDQTNQNSASSYLLTLGVITVSMSHLSSLHPLIAGLGTFLALMNLMALVALSRGPQTTTLLCGVAAMLGTAACWFCGSDLSVSIVIGASAIGTAALMTLSWLVCQASRRSQRQIADLTVQQDDLVRKLYEHEKSSLSGEIPIFSRPALFPTTPDLPESLTGALASDKGLMDPNLSDREFFDFAMLLLSMQQIGQRLSSQLDLKSLVAAIQEIAQEVLHCQHAQLSLWNPQTQQFYDASLCSTDGTPATLDEISRSEACNPAFDWVLANRRILARREVASGRLGESVSRDLAEAALPAAVAPLLVGNDLIGVLLVDQVEDESPTFVWMLFIFASHCALSVKNAQLFRHIEDMARRDSLTGLLNHASFLEELDHLVDHAQANHELLTVVMGDIDHFKKVNDTFGHQAGDFVLQEVSRWWRAIMPDRALLARYGGEEFICVLPNEDLHRGCELAELLRASLEANPVNYGGRQLQVTASFGVAELGKPAPNVTRLIRLADKALYRAKNSGRNRVDSHDPTRSEIADMNESTQFAMPSESPYSDDSDPNSEINWNFSSRRS